MARPATAGVGWAERSGPTILRVHADAGVVIKVREADAFVLTAYLTDRIKRG